MKKSLKAIVVSIAVLAVASFAGAQGPGGPGGPGKGQHGPGGGRMMQEMIQKLNLTPAQQTKLQAIQKKYQPKMQALFKANQGSNDRKAMFEKMRPIMEAEHKDIRAMLTPAQKKTFDQMMAERKARMEQHMKGGQGKPGGGAH